MSSYPQQLFFLPQSIAIAMAVGKQTPQVSATQSELDQQDKESCDSLVLTVSDGSVRVKSEWGQYTLALKETASSPRGR